MIKKRNSTQDQELMVSVQQILQSESLRDIDVVNLLPFAVYITDSSGVIIKYNHKAVELWGKAPNLGDKDELLYSSFSSYHPNGLPHEHNTVMKRADHTQIQVRVNITPIKNEQGIVIGRINSLYEIETSEELRRELDRETKQWQDYIQTLSAAVYTTDNEGKITMFNKAAAELWGREPEIGKDLWCGSYKIFKTDGSELPLDNCPMAVCLKEHRAVYGEEILIVRPDGSTRFVAPHPQPLFDDKRKMIGAINLLVDITDVKRTENALRESEAKYRELASSLEMKVEEKTADLQLKNQELKRSEERYHKMVEEVEDYAIILLDKNGIIQNWNKGAEKIKGYKEEEIVGKSFNNFYLPEDRNSGLPQMLLKQASHKGKAIHEGWRMRKDGTVFWGSIVLTALHDDQNNILGFSKVTRDLTERKLSEDRLREYNSQLEFQNKELEQFAYAASHDMKEPLRKIHLYNSSIAENPANILDEKSREFLNRSLNAVKRITDLIEDLLTYSKTTANIESFDEVDLTAVLEEIKLIHKEEFDEKKVEIDTDELPKIFAVPFQIKQLMFNLINNSIKYQHPDRKVKIQLKADVVKGSEIKDHEADPSKNYHRISVIDNGIGFEAKHAETIFNIFQRLNNVPTTKGSGIGLAICKRIIQNHHGFIKAFGKEGQGARFDIFLPKEL
jgi:PAS domain S-box-containing protein